MKKLTALMTLALLVSGPLWAETGDPAAGSKKTETSGLVKKAEKAVKEQKPNQEKAAAGKEDVHKKHYESTETKMEEIDKEGTR